MSNYRVAFISLGCAKNLVNTEQMAALVREAGHTIVPDPEGADVCVLNTCGFIDSAKSEAIDHILELARLKDAGQLKKILVAGCLSQRYREDIRTELPEVDGMLGTGSYNEVGAAIEAVMGGESPECFGDISHTYDDGERLVSTVPWSAYLKIAEGCDNYCAFCIIPYLRGHYRSRSMESLLAEAKKLSDAGVKELIVIAQDITRYGVDLYKKPMLAELLRELCKLDFHWIRLHYLYPDMITDELIDVMAEHDKILNYLAVCPARARRSLRNCVSSWRSSASSAPVCSSIPLRRAPGRRRCRIRWIQRLLSAGSNWWWISSPASWMR